uniref:hypothetical protein n=1 Tax=Lactobacillus helveticus TaxID=1587 RepID=UPI0021A5184D|nr:hypothetical protein [Lactobacillus helveticus]
MIIPAGKLSLNEVTSWRSTTNLVPGFKFLRTVLPLLLKVLASQSACGFITAVAVLTTGLALKLATLTYLFDVGLIL